MESVTLIYNSQWFSELALEVNASTTKVMFISNNESDKCDTPIIMNQTELEVVKSHKHLGVILSNDLKWTKHIDHIHAKSNKTLGIIKAASHNMPCKCLDKAYSTVVRPTLEYASPLWAGLWAQDADHFESIQYQAGRVITGAMKFTPKVKVREELQLDSLVARCDAASLQIMHRIVNKNAPAHLQTLKPKMLSEVHGVNTRNATSKTLGQPKVRLQSTQNWQQ